MAYSEKLAGRVREALAEVPKVEEKKMFRGVTFMVDGKMCVSVSADRLMCRIDPAIHDAAVERNGCQGVIMKGREYKGFVYVDEDALKSKKEFDYWIGLCLDFNERAKASPKKKKAAARAAKKSGPTKKASPAKRSTPPISRTPRRPGGRRTS